MRSRMRCVNMRVSGSGSCRQANWIRRARSAALRSRGPGRGAARHRFAPARDEVREHGRNRSRRDRQRHRLSCGLRSARRRSRCGTSSRRPRAAIASRALSTCIRTRPRAARDIVKRLPDMLPLYAKGHRQDRGCACRTTAGVGPSAPQAGARLTSVALHASAISSGRLADAAQTLLPTRRFNSRPPRTNLKLTSSSRRGRSRPSAARGR